jgi:HPr kinase/phosphorylase
MAESKISMHGSLLEVSGTGVLLTGKSAIGKSEIALNLIERGNRLIGDDMVNLIRSSSSSLIGTCPKMLRDFLHIRDLGMINIRALFGNHTIIESHTADLIIELNDGDAAILPNSASKIILEIPIPVVKLAIRPYRDMALLIETIVRNYQLGLAGYESQTDFLERHAKHMENVNSQDNI